MFTKEALSEIHFRAHKSLEILIKHCARFSEKEINQTFESFGDATIRLNIHHIIGAELYWIEVLKNKINVDENIQDYPHMDALNEFRISVFKNTRKYLKEVSSEQLNSPGSFMTWGGNECVMVPANVIMRPVTHCYHHAGQVSIMCKILGKSVPPFDYPLKGEIHEF